MASIKISELNEYTEVQDDDLFVVVDVNNKETKKVKATNIGTGGKELIMVGDESVATSNTKLLIETDSLASLGTEVVDTLDGNETTMAPSVRAVNEVLNYSLEEKVVGKWIDGKPLYRKVYDGITINGNETIIDTTIGATVIMIYGWIVKKSDGFIQPLGSYLEDGSQNTSRLFWDGTHIKVQASTRYNTGDFNARVLVEYTKTTD